MTTWCHGCGKELEGDIFGHICDPDDLPEPSDQLPYITIWHGAADGAPMPDTWPEPE